MDRQYDISGFKREIETVLNDVKMTCLPSSSKDVAINRVSVFNNKALCRKVAVKLLRGLLRLCLLNSLISVVILG